MPNLLDWFSWGLNNLARGVRLIETGPIELSGIAIVIVIFISIRIIAYCIKGLERNTAHQCGIWVWIWIGRIILILLFHIRLEQYRYS
jgi:hypothetical protein